MSNTATTCLSTIEACFEKRRLPVEIMEASPKCENQIATFSEFENRGWTLSLGVLRRPELYLDLHHKQPLQIWRAFKSGGSNGMWQSAAHGHHNFLLFLVKRLD